MATIFEVDGGVHLHSYCKDKADLVLISLARQADLLRDPNVLDAAIREDVLDQLHAAIIMTTRVLAVASKTNLTDADARVIFRDGLRGYQQLAIERGVPSRVLDRDLRTGEEKFADFAKELAPLLEGPRSNRTVIHQLLLAAPIEDRRVRRIADLTESLTMGTLTWPDYVSEVRPIL